MKRKNMLFLLLTMFLSSCQINNNSNEPLNISYSMEESNSEVADNIYYVDGLPSNLFVTGLNEYMEYLYIEEEDCYFIDCVFSYPFPEYIEKIIFPNVFDDGIHGLKRVKHVSCWTTYVPIVEEIIISEGIETIRSYYYDREDNKINYHPGNMIWFVCEDLYLPISIKEVSHAFDTCSSNLIDSLMKGERSFNIHYNNTIEYFNNNCSITMPITSVDFHLQTRDLLKINCLDGYVKLNYYIGEYLE